MIRVPLKVGLPWQISGSATIYSPSSSRCPVPCRGLLLSFFVVTLKTLIAAHENCKPLGALRARPSVGLLCNPPRTWFHPADSCGRGQIVGMAQTAISVQRGAASETDAFGDGGTGDLPIPGFDDFSGRHAVGQFVEDLPDHDAGAFERRLAVRFSLHIAKVASELD